MSTEDFNFEQAMEELNKIVVQMEQGGLSLEESLKSFEKGVALTQQCQKALQSAEQKVQKLIKNHGEFLLDDYKIEE